MQSDHTQPAVQRRLLRSVPILAALSEDEIDRLAETTAWKSVTRGQEVLSHLTTSMQVYFLIQGTLRAQLTSAHGKTIAIRKLQAGSHFGELAALTGAPRSVTVVADTDALIAEWSADTFQEMMRTNARFAEAIAVSLARNVVLLTDRLFELAALEVRFRLYAELLRLARNGEATDGGVLIRDAPTHETLASTIGAQREAVTREMSYLTAENIMVAWKREVLITDMQRLQEMVRQRAGLTASQIADWQP
jgi:CRP/FNR family cyclic AMP-dependent transcriptional regulator